MGSDCKFCSLSFISRGLSLIVLVIFICGAFRLRLKFDESPPKLGDAINLSGSGIGNLMGDMFFLVRRGVDVVEVEGDLIFVKVDGVLVGAI